MLSEAACGIYLAYVTQPYGEASNMWGDINEFKNLKILDCDTFIAQYMLLATTFMALTCHAAHQHRKQRGVQISTAALEAHRIIAL